MVRMGKENFGKALQHSHAREMDFTGKPLTGFVYIEAEGIAEDEDLQYWVKKVWITSLRYPPRASNLPPCICLAGTLRHRGGFENNNI